jgi:hypothetical protein
VSEDDCEDGEEKFGKGFAMSTILKRLNGVDVAVVEIVLEAGLVGGSGDVEVETLQPTRLEVIASTVLEDFRTLFSMAGVPIDEVSGAEASRTDRVRDETRALAQLLIIFTERRRHTWSCRSHSIQGDGSTRRHDKGRCRRGSYRS